MQELELFKLFTNRLNELSVRYMLTGAVASIIYGEPRMTHDMDVVIEMEQEDVEKFCNAFPLDEFYCPPPEVIKVELVRRQRGHFNLIHHKTGFKADVYTSGSDALHLWAIEKRNKIEIEGDVLWLAPIEYVILRKLEYYQERRSEKHLRDIKGMLMLSPDLINMEELKTKIKERHLSEAWHHANLYPDK